MLPFELLNSIDNVGKRSPPGVRDEAGGRAESIWGFFLRLFFFLEFRRWSPSSV